MLENLNILISYGFFYDTIYNFYNCCLNILYYFYFFKFLTCGFNEFYGFYIITEIPFSQLWQLIFPWTLPSPFHDFYLNFEFYLGSLDPDFDFSSPTYFSKLFGWLYCCGKRDKDKSPDVEIYAWDPTKWRGWRPSGQQKRSADYDYESSYGFGFGYDTPVNDKGKGKEIPKDTDIPVEIPKNSLDSCTSSNNNSIMPKGHRDSLTSTNYSPTTSSCPSNLYQLQLNLKPKAPYNTPSSSRFDLQKPNSSNGNGGSGSGGSGGWFSNWLENLLP